MATPQAALELIQYLHLKLAALGQTPGKTSPEAPFLQVAQPLLRNYFQKERLLGKYLCPADARIQSFIDDYLGDCLPAGVARLPATTFVLDRARARAHAFAAARFAQFYFAVSALLSGARRACCTIPRATAAPREGVFHIAEGGLPVPADKASRAEAGVRRAAGRGPPSAAPMS